ncbi:MAG TPA: endo alpha-1,4 polygalactosaminidase [Polyangia bacterium]|nr:endo alpha-1,4 polygalactosaminidase [Polyangia bacterium]
MRGLTLGLLAGLFASCSLPAFPSGQSLEHVRRWWIVLGDPQGAAGADWIRALQGADLAIVNHAPPPGASSSALVLGYLSIGEAETTRAYWPQIARRPFVVERNPDWPDNYRVDIRDSRWQAILLDEEIPRLLAAGYQGLMLDTLDNAPYLERREPTRFEGSRDGLRDFLGRVRKKFPKLILLANGTDTLVDAAPFVDGYVTEGIFATYDASPLRYRRTTASEREWRLAQVKAALDRARRPVFAVEYAGPESGELAAWAVEQSRQHGFRPFVTEKSLNRLPDVAVAATFPTGPAGPRSTPAPCPTDSATCPR